MDQHPRAVLGDEVMPSGSVGKVNGGCPKMALATSRKTGLTEACFCIATQGQPQAGGGSNSVRARVGRKQLGAHQRGQ